MSEYRVEEQARERAAHAERMRREYLDRAVPAEVADHVYTLAWDQGHAYGFSEVESCYIDLADLAEKAYRAGADA